MSGFCSSVVFKEIDENDINTVELFVREELSAMWHDERVTLAYGNESKDAFGPFYAFNPSSFKFLPGDKKLIRKLVDHVNSCENQEITIASGTDGKEMTAVHVQNLNSAELLPVRDFETRTNFFLNKLQTVAKFNFSKKSKEGFRFDDEIKMYAAYLRMICGPLAYNTIQRNLEGALPALVSANRYINRSEYAVAEGVLRSKDLLKYLTELNSPLAVCISEDCTRVEGRIQYDSKTNQIIGFTAPINKLTGLPMPFAFPARNAEEIFNYFSSENSVSSFVDIIMAQPLANVPPFCLAIFGSDSKYTSTDIENRWSYIKSELNKLDIKVLIISSDSDPKYNRAMRNLSGLFELSDKELFDWRACNSNSIDYPFFVQDPTHIGTKLRNFLLRYKNKSLAFGTKYSIELDHLYILLNTVPKDQHLLTLSTLNPADRQNFASVLRMCSDKVTTLLKSRVKDSDATVLFLEMWRDILDSYMDVNLAPLVRIKKIWTAVFILRIWRNSIKTQKKGASKKASEDNFLTANCYSCIELNAFSLVQCLLYLKEHNLPNLFLPHLYSSQTCESTFRQLRSFTSTYSTVVNCSVKETLSRVSKIQLQNEIVYCKSSNFFYPKSKKQNNAFNIVYDLPSKSEILKTIMNCKSEAIKISRHFGFKVRNHKHLFSCAIPKLLSQKQKKSIDTNVEVKSILNGLLRLNDLKNANLINFVRKHPNPDEKSPFVKLHEGKVVKKTSLCWLLRNDCKKLSSDRIRRVMALKENDYVNNKRNCIRNQVKIKCSIYQYKPPKKSILKKCSLKSFAKYTNISNEEK